MKRLSTIFCAAALLVLPVRAATLISNFDTFSSQYFPPMAISWALGDVDQYTQSSGFISITAVGGGNPMGDGYFIAGMPGVDLNNPDAAAIDLTGSNFFNLTARVDAENASSIANLIFYDSEFTQIGSATFLATEFGSSFTTVSKAITFTGVGNIAQATYFRIDGDGISSNAYRYSFSDLTASAAPIPEPSAVLLALGGLTLIGAWRRLGGPRKKLRSC